MKNLSSAICCALLICVSASGQQPEPAKSVLISTMTLETAQQIIQGLGFKCTWEKDEKGVPNTYFIFRAEGFKVGVEVPTANFIWLYNIFTDPATPETINEWNSKNRFSRAYIASDKNLYLDTEIIVKGGITRENIEAQIDEFRDSVARWARFVIDHQKH
jgi:hypothetical protein